MGGLNEAVKGVNCLFASFVGRFIRYCMSEIVQRNFYYVYQVIFRCIPVRGKDASNSFFAKFVFCYTRCSLYKRRMLGDSTCRLEQYT